MNVFSARKPRHKRQRGGTLAEVMLATLVVGTTLVATASSMSQSATVYAFFTDGPHEALMLAQEIHEASGLLPWEADVGAPATFGDDVTTLWDLDDQEYNPPRSAQYETVSSHPKWTQLAEVDFVSLDDPSQVVDPDVFGGETLVRLTVTISRLEEEMGSFEWWMTEPSDD